MTRPCRLNIEEEFISIWCAETDECLLSWDSQDWRHDPHLVPVIAKAARVALNEGADMLRARIAAREFLPYWNPERMWISARFLSTKVGLEPPSFFEMDWIRLEVEGHPVLLQFERTRFSAEPLRDGRIEVILRMEIFNLPLSSTQHPAHFPISFRDLSNAKILELDDYYEDPTGSYRLDALAFEKPSHSFGSDVAHLSPLSITDFYRNELFPSPPPQKEDPLP